MPQFEIRGPTSDRSDRRARASRRRRPHLEDGLRRRGSAQRPSASPMASKASASSATPAVFWLNVFEPVAVRNVVLPGRTCTMPAEITAPKLSPGTPMARSAVARVAVVAGGERGAEAVVRLGAVPDAGRVLRPQLAAGRGEAGDAPGDQMDDAVVRARAALARRPDREVEEAVAAEVADRHGVAELVAVLRRRRRSRRWPARRSGCRCPSGRRPRRGSSGSCRRSRPRRCPRPARRRPGRRRRCRRRCRWPARRRSRRPSSAASPTPVEFWLHSELPVALSPVAEPSRTWTTP